MFHAIRKFFSKTTSYRFHLTNGSTIETHGVLSLRIEWGTTNQEMRSYNIKWIDARYNNLFYLKVDTIVAIEEIK